MTTNNIKKVEYVKELDSGMLTYMFATITDRAIPSLLDGLKPVQRKILYAMDEIGLRSNKPPRKSAHTVGKVLSHYYSHGDSSAYQTLIKMSQDFYMRHPYVTVQGNNGNIDGDTAAAMRYTESKLSKFSEDSLFHDLKYKPVPFIPNYDNTTTEPEYLPSRFPNVLLNGSYGIASAYVSSIPPHNINELGELLIEYINSGLSMDIKEMAKKIRPDYPTGGIITNDSELTKAYMTGQGNITLRGEIELLPKKDKKGREVLKISSIPYMTTAGDIRKKINEKVKDGSIEGIDHITVLSKGGIDIRVHIKKGFSPDVVMSMLYKHTALESTQLIRMIAIDQHKAYKNYNIKTMLDEWINFRRSTLKQIYTSKIKKNMERKIHIDSLLLAVKDIDWVINTIKSSPSIEDATVAIQEKFGIPSAQAEIITNMRIKVLNSLESDKLVAEEKVLMEEIEIYQQVLTHESIIDKLIIEDIESIVKSHSSERKTQLTDMDTDIDIEDVINDEEFQITFTNNGYIKRHTPRINKQKRGGKGRSLGRVRDGDMVKKMFIANSKDHFLMFTNQGKAYNTKVWKVPEVGSMNALGKPFSSFINLDKDEKVINAINLTNDQFDSDTGRLVMVTQRGYVKQVAISEFKNLNESGLIAAKLPEEDKLKEVIYYDSKDEDDYNLFIGSSKGIGILLPLKEVGLLKRNTTGSIGINIDKETSVVGAQLIRKDSKGYIIPLTTNGLGKRVLCKEFIPQSRGGKGRILVKMDNGVDLVNFHVTEDDDDILSVFTSSRLVSVKVNEISVLKRPAKGVRIINLDKDTHIIGSTLIS